ncbi:hypothetical protein SAMN04489730_6510 [Amycolatopsis australiensis]|uniref:RHIM domain-containing protein n=1 Tax=Amycolatopsis australiensis TaxID=546364 RepID=A0A1K1SRG5_9PSEU|nr:hypothetical protein SAMN04489730_6510 [Amycolatopsis australiensis]
MLESVGLVVAALSAGAAAGAGGAASAAVRDGYEGLKSLTLRAVRRSPSTSEDGQAVLEAGLAVPEAHQAELAAALSAAAVELDDELVAAARHVLELTGLAGVSDRRYGQVEVRDNQGVQVGDHNTQTNTFTS